MSKVTLQRALPVLVSAAVLTFLFQRMDLAGLADALTWRVAAIMIGSFLVYGAATLLLEALSLGMLARMPREEFGLWVAARLKSASYLVGIVNYALGAGALALLLRRHTRLSLGEAASLVLLISSSDLVVVLAMAGAGAALVETNAPTVQAGVIAVAMLGFFGGLALLRIPGSLGPFDRIRSLAIFEGLRTVPLPRLGALLVVRVLFASCFVGVCAASFYAFGVRPPAAELVVGMLVVGVVAGVPIAVAGLGTSQAAFLFIFAEYAPQELLLAQSLALTACMLGLRGSMGLLFAREFTREVLRETRGSEA
ncbi:MAG TPA: lysylphosphatidylglycerol synthase domain-containing protein [Myxococcota bacterium]